MTRYDTPRLDPRRQIVSLGFGRGDDVDVPIALIATRTDRRDFGQD